jgi:hypothetical protein
LFYVEKTERGRDFNKRVLEVVCFLVSPGTSFRSHQNSANGSLDRNQEFQQPEKSTWRWGIDRADVQQPLKDERVRFRPFLKFRFHPGGPMRLHSYSIFMETHNFIYSAFTNTSLFVFFEKPTITSNEDLLASCYLLILKFKSGFLYNFAYSFSPSEH